ncbi:MAG: sigma-70 family RNA polymerase sigma factor [bacterium]|nr:sigma-70 family RNA polymerase sigma factor [bacterium]
MEDRRGEVTQLLRGGATENNALLALVYDELRTIADRRMLGERSGHTLQATALVHEAYMRLVDDEAIDWNDRRHFYAAAAEAMRRILIDHARRVKSLKRGGDRHRVTFGGAEAPVDMPLGQADALHEALEQLKAEDERAADVTHMRFLLGLSVQETAKALGISERSVHREWTYARARLFEILEDD